MRGVLLLRNPIDAAIAFRNYLSGGHTGMAEADQFTGPGWDEFVRKTCFYWVDHATKQELKRIIPQFYSAPIDSDRLKCAVDHKNRTDRKRLQRTRSMKFQF
jgi:hypothetical protein